MKNTIKKYIPEIAGAIIGGLGGFLYWKYVGCISGTCAIKSNWYLMVPWGILFGVLMASLARDLVNKVKLKKNDGDK